MSQSNNFIPQEELLEQFGFTRVGDLKRRLRAYQIPFFIGKGGRVVVTKEAMNDRRKSSIDNGEKITF